MLVSLPFRRFIQRVAHVLPRRSVSGRLRRRCGGLSFCAAATVEMLESRVLPSSIVVNSTSGGQDYASTVTVGQLDPATTAVTLRDAINAANNTQGADTISFDASIFPPSSSTPTTITLSGGTILEFTDKSGATTIDGLGAGQVAVSGNGLSTVFMIDAGVSATIEGLTITGGQASVAYGTGNKAGGGIYNAGTLVLEGDAITGNAAATYGGGFFNDGGSVTVADSTLTGNSAQFGGGFFNAGTVTVSESTLAGNSASSSGGGFYSQGTVTLTCSTLAGNSAAACGGGFYSNNTATVTACTLSGNSAGSDGGGFFNSRNVTVTQSTLAGNSAQFGGGFTNFGAAAVAASTIAGNFAQSGGGIGNLGTVTLSGTILAGNTVSPTNAATSDWGGNAADSSSSYNLIGDGTKTGLANGVNNNIVGTSTNPVDPYLAALADNGGPTQTMALLAGSPAINAGGNALVTALATDQRGTGFSRIAGGIVDIGAFEIQSHPPAVPTVVLLTTDNSTPALTGTWDPTNAVLLQVTISNSAGSFSATYTLGSSSQFTTSGQTWSLNLAGTTPIPVGTYNVLVHSANDIGETADDSGTLQINDPAPSLGSLNPQSATVGQQVAISAAITGGDTTGLTATIDWGDGTTTAATVATVSGVLTVSGSHAYSAAGTFAIQLTVTNAGSQSTTVATTATVSQPANLHVVEGRMTRIRATDLNAAYDFEIKFVSGGLELIGTNGTTFNGQSTLFVASAASVSVSLGNGDDHVLVTGVARRVSLDTEGGHDDVTFQNFTGRMVQVSADGILTLHAIDSTMRDLLVMVEGSAPDSFQAFHLRVTDDARQFPGRGVNSVQIDELQFDDFSLRLPGSATSIPIVAHRSHGWHRHFFPESHD